MKLLSNSPQPFFHSESMCEIIKYSLNNVILIIKSSLSNVILIFRRADIPQFAFFAMFAPLA